MARTMADRLAGARERTFVGRRAELAAFGALLDSEDPAVVVVHGPPGIGKSTLTRRLAALATERGATCWPIDGRDLPPSLQALEFGLAPLVGDSPPPGRQVVLVDNYELLEPVDTALREQLAPRLPADTVLVLAGQQPPSVGWRSDEGWAPLLHTFALENLDHEDCGRYLAAHAVPIEQHEAAISFSHGHPLALALVGEVLRQRGTMTAADSADVVGSLTDRVLDRVPTPTHRSALEALAEVRSLDEPLLAALLGRTEVYDLFAWLRVQPYVQRGAYGLVLHDLVREVLTRDLRWRHPEQYAALHDRARAVYLERLDHDDPAVQAMALLDLIYLHPDLRVFLQASEASAGLRIEPATGADRTAVVAMVERHEGAESASIARYWFKQRPDTWWVVRDAERVAAGALCVLPLERSGAEPGIDPALDHALDALRAHPPLRPGEVATMFRFWLAGAEYQSVSTVQSIIATQFARHFLTTRGLAVTVIPFAEPAAWETFCAYADQHRLPAADFTVGGRTYTCFGHDWRIVPAAAWLAGLSRRELGSGGPVHRTPDESAPVLVLDEAAFATAVRQALRDYSRPDRLRTSPLLQCRFVTTRLSGGESLPERVEVLRAQVKEAADSLAEVPADRRLHRVLVRAYLAPAPSLERAAEVLELPSSTFRRLLGAAVGRVATLLWHRELDA